mgnify:CR=1 FL=1
MSNNKKRQAVRSREEHHRAQHSACVAALVNAKTHGARFHATHGTHSTSDDIMKSVELGERMVLREKLQKEKKLRIQQQTLEDNAKLILDAGKNVESLLVSELDTLLAWHGVAKTKGSKKEDKLQQWKDIVATGQQPPQFSRWTDDDEQKLAPLMSDEVDMVDTYYGREQALHERELEATMYCMSREKREEFRRKLDEIDREYAATSVPLVSAETSQEGEEESA